MTYKLGKYKYKSQKAYERLLIRISTIFIICLFLLYILKENMSPIVYCGTALVDVLMIAHLSFRFLDSKKLIKYPLKTY